MARRSAARRARARQGPGHHAPPFDLANERRQVGVDHLRPAIRRGGEAGGRSGGSEARRRTNRPGNHARGSHASAPPTRPHPSALAVSPAVVHWSLVPAGGLWRTSGRAGRGTRHSAGTPHKGRRNHARGNSGSGT